MEYIRLFWGNLGSYSYMELLFVFSLILTIMTFTFFAMKEVVIEVNEKTNVPPTTLDAIVVNRREVTRKNAAYYYVTFELESKETIEFRVSRTQYRDISYYEYGALTHINGKWFKSFIAVYTELRR